MTHVAEPTPDTRSRLGSQMITWQRDTATLSHGAVAVEELGATYGTPLYVYDAEVMERQYAMLREALPPPVDIYYSIKANPHPSIIGVFLSLGAGCEIASGGEYALARRAGVPPERIIFAGPGKGREELEYVLARGIQEIHVESFDELELLKEITARMQTAAAVSIRVNPNAASGASLMMGGQPTAFGFEQEALPDAVRAVARCARLELRGLHVYFGTQILDARSLLANWQHAIDLTREMASLTGQTIVTVDLGGGLGVPYFSHERPLDLDALRDGATELFASARSDERFAQAHFIVEPGRFLVAAAGLYLARVRSVKTCRGATFVVLDGGMNHHLAASGNLGQVVRRDYPMLNLSRRTKPEVTAVVVGPLCTPIDTLGRQIKISQPQVGDLLGILLSGAYGLAASPAQFLSHPTPAEVLIRRNTVECITPRGSTFG